MAVLQLLPFAVGLALRKWSPELPVAIDERDAAERRAGQRLPTMIDPNNSRGIGRSHSAATA